MRLMELTSDKINGFLLLPLVFVRAGGRLYQSTRFVKVYKLIPCR